MKELTYPLSSHVNRRTFLEVVAVSTGTNLLATSLDRAAAGSSAFFLENTAEKLTQNRQLVTQYLQFREGFRDEGYDVSQYSLWNAVEHFGLIQSLSYANTNPLVFPNDSEKTISKIASMKDKMADQSIPNYSENIWKDFQAGELGLLTAGAAYSLNRHFKDLEKSDVSASQKMTRRSFMNALAIGFGALNVAATVESAGRISQYDMVNRTAYHNIPGAVLKQLATGDATKNFLNFYSSSLASLPSPISTQLMTEEHFYEGQEKIMDTYDEAWKKILTPEEESDISAKANSLRQCTYEAYRNRFDAIQNAVNDYFPGILHAPPESPILSYQFSEDANIINTGVGLELLDIVKRNQTDFSFDIEEPTIK